MRPTYALWSCDRESLGNAGQYGLSGKSTHQQMRNGIISDTFLCGWVSHFICQRSTYWSPLIYLGLLMNWQILGYFAKIPRWRTQVVTTFCFYLFLVKRWIYRVYRLRGFYLDGGVKFQNIKFERDVFITPHFTQFFYENVLTNYGCPSSRPSSGLIFWPLTLYQYSYWVTPNNLYILVTTPNNFY